MAKMRFDKRWDVSSADLIHDSADETELVGDLAIKQSVRGSPVSDRLPLPVAVASRVVAVVEDAHRHRARVRSHP